MKGDFFMKKMACFWKSLLPMIFLFILQVVATIPVMIIFALKDSSAAGGDIAAILGSLSDITSNQQYLQDRFGTARKSSQPATVFIRSYP